MKEWSCILMVTRCPLFFAFLKLFRQHVSKLALCFLGIEKAAICESLQSQLIVKAKVDVVFGSTIPSIVSTLCISTQWIIQKVTCNFNCACRCCVCGS